MTVQPAEQTQETPQESTQKPKVETTQEEIDGYLIVKAILREHCDAARIVARDTQSYMGILLDDTNRKPLCRLHFNGQTKHIGLFDCEKKEERMPLKDLDEIFKHADRIIAAFKGYESLVSSLEG